MEVCVGLPNLLQHFDIQTEMGDGERVRIFLHPREAETLITPILAKVAVHGVILQKSLKDRTKLC